MKVLFANNICGFYGGVEQVIVHISRELRSRGHLCYLAYSSKDRNADEFIKHFDGTYACEEFINPCVASSQRTFTKIIGNVRPDVVFFHKVTRLPDGAEFMEGFRKVRMVHDTDLFCPTGLGYFRHGRKVCHVPAGWRCWLDLAFLGRSCGGRIPVKLVDVSGKIREMRRNHHMDSILAVSTFVRDKLVQNGFPPDRVHLCHPILEVEDPEPSVVPDGPRILYVGALLRGKGVDLLLRALARLTVPFSLNIVGTGKSEHKLKQLCHGLGLDHRVKFMGWVPHDEIAQCYREAKVIAIPSRGPESFTLVGQESMRHGRPVVAFDVGGNSNWLDHEHTGYIVPEQDVKSYAQGLERLLTDTAHARQLGENAARRVRERFPFERYLDKVEGFLRGENERVDSEKASGAPS